MHVVFIFNKPNRRRLRMCTATMTITIMINVAAATTNIPTSCLFPFLKRRTHKYSSIRVALNHV